MRTHLLFFDGSAVSASRGRDNDFSNVHKLNVAFDFQGDEGKPQFVHYFGGVGTRGDWLAAATGRGFDQIVKEAYLNLSSNYEDEDTIGLFGFSRGAAAARALAFMIERMGLLPPHELHLFPDLWMTHLKEQKLLSRKEIANFPWKDSAVPISDLVLRPRIKVLGLFDTVPGNHWDRRRLVNKTVFQDGPLESNVDVGIHILSIDDRRRPWFEPLLWKGKADGQVLEQIWMPGVHSDIGGSSRCGLLNDLALQTMIDRIMFHCPELKFAEGDIGRIIDEGGQHQSYEITNERSEWGRLMFPRPRQIGTSATGCEYLHPVYKEMVGSDITLRGRKSPYRPKNVPGTKQVIELGPFYRECRTAGTTSDNRSLISEST